MGRIAQFLKIDHRIQQLDFLSIVVSMGDEIKRASKRQQRHALGLKLSLENPRDQVR